MPSIHIVAGAKAQYLKMAPLLRRMDQAQLAYRLVDTGQHGGLAADLRAGLGLREPDVCLGPARDVVTVGQGLWWSARLAALLARPANLHEHVFAGDGGIAVVHGDTASTWLGAVLARRAGLRVAQVEAGLRSGSWLHPFPEEAIRVAVGRRAELLFAPDDTSAGNLHAARVQGRVVRTSANTMVEALRHALGDRGAPTGDGAAVFSMHRLENLHHRGRLRRFVALAAEVGARRPVRLVLHGPTRTMLERRGLLPAGHRDGGLAVSPLLPHAEFAALLHAAPFVVTDGGSIQEECAALGVPTLLWRARTERVDGLGRNVVLSRYDEQVVRGFLADPQRFRHDPLGLDATPSAEILDVLLAELDASAR